jgi:hypothetical protein
MHKNYFCVYQARLLVQDVTLHPKLFWLLGLSVVWLQWIFSLAMHAEPYIREL